VIGATKRAQQSAWLAWAYQAQLYESGEHALGRLRAAPAAILHAGVARVCVANGYADASRPIPVLVFVSLSCVRTERVTDLSHGRARIELVRQWPLERYAPVVSDDERIITFRSVDDGATDDMVYLDCSESHSGAETGWWIQLAVYARQHGVETALTGLRLRRAEHLNREPDCPLSPEKRREHLGSVDQLGAR
jgi:hypothetical protein